MLIIGLENTLYRSAGFSERKIGSLTLFVIKHYSPTQ